MMKDYLDDLIEKLIEAGIASKDSVKPCSPEQISTIEQIYSISLPLAYKQFLSKMGFDAGSFLDGTDFFYPYLPKLRGYAEELLERWDRPFSLSKTDFVFLCHQGKQFMYFDTTAGDDPAIYYYKEAQYESQKVNDSFSNWLQCRVEEAVLIQEKIKAL